MAGGLATPPPRRVARRASGLVLAGAALAALVGWLLVANYRAARTLRENLLAQHAQEVELHASAVAGLLGGAEEDLRNLAESREVAAFFESRDLGMSMHYGLALALVPIRQRLEVLCERGRAGAPPAFRRVAFLDAGGAVLADSARPDAPRFPGALDGTPDTAGARLAPDGRELLLSRAHWFKGRLVGHLVAWLRSDTVMASMRGPVAAADPSLVLLLADDSGREWRPAGAPPLPPGAPAGLAAVPASGRVVELPSRWLATARRVPGQPLALVHAHPEGALLGTLTPLASAVTLSIAAGAVLVLVLFGLHTSTKSLVLKARLGESLRREREVAEKHAALEREAAERERAQAALRASEEQFRLIFDTVPEGIALLRADDGTVLDVNPGFERTFGWRREDVARRPLAELGLPALDRALVRRPLRQGELRGLEVRASRRDGAALDVQLSARTTELAGERVVVVVARDVTEERRLAETVRHSQRLEAFGDLAAGIAHNFNNALAAVLPNIESCLGDVPAGALPALEDARQAARNAVELARQLMLVARRDREGRREPVDAVRTVHDVLRMCRSTFDRIIRIEQAVPPGRAVVLGPPGHLHQVLLNLCINARDAVAGRPSPTLRLEVDERDGPVPGGVGPATARHLVIRVQDDGCGMSPATLRRIGEPFFSTKGPGRGTGLGLATAFGIVHDLGGRLTCASREGEGTVFTVELPLAAEQASEAAPAPRPRARAGRRVLVVDDEPLVRKAMARQLRGLGADVVGAADGAEGLERARAERFDVVLLDLSMPGMPGAQVLSQLRARRGAPPVIVVSGNAEPAGVEAAAAVLEKPVGAAELSSAIAQAIAAA